MTELFVVVALQYLQRGDLENGYTNATRHWLYHGPATLESCMELKAFVEDDPDYSWNVYYNILSVSQYQDGRFE